MLTNIDELSLTHPQKMAVLEWLAKHLWYVMEESTDRDYHCKSYDPLTLESRSDGTGVAHSYVFDMWDGGRHHEYTTLTQVEEAMVSEVVGTIRDRADD